MSRSRGWVGTLNNYNDLEEDFAKAMETTYSIIGHEIGENGTPHLQSFFYFKNALTMAGVKKRIGSNRWHLEPLKGTPEQADAYCRKEDHNYWNRGILPRQGERTDLGMAIQLLQDNNNDVKAIARELPQVFIKYHKGLSALSTALAPLRTWKTTVISLYGPTGTGKTRAAYSAAPIADVYWKMGSNQWWDGYAGHPIVILDDYRRDLCPFHTLLRMMDRYPLTLEVKGGSISFQAKVMILTSPKSLASMWEGRTDEEIAQLERRINYQFEFPRNSTILHNAEEDHANFVIHLRDIIHECLNL